MDYLNLVFSALTLLATVTLGVIRLTFPNTSGRCF